ncbi:MAG: sigma-70 factor domain-containing protein [Chthoniobacterales bacterium]
MPTSYLHAIGQVPLFTAAQEEGDLSRQVREARKRRRTG